MFVFVIRIVYSKGNLVGCTNDTESRASTSVTRLLGLLVAALAEIVGTSVHDDGSLVASASFSVQCKEARKKMERWREEETYADNALGADQLDQLVGVASLGVTLAVSLEVAQVTDVALVVVGGTVGLVVGVDCSALVAGLTFQVSRR